MNTKIITESSITAKRKQWEGKRIVLVGGCFDLLHYGHYSFLASSKEQGDILVVALEPDEFIVTRKKRPPIHNQQQRAQILAGLESVDAVITLPLYTKHAQYSHLVDLVKPDVIAITAGDQNLAYKQAHAEKIGAQIIEVTQPVESFSTSSIIAYANLLRD